VATINGKMLKSKKHVFWEALLVTILIFLGGLFIGMLVETGNSSKIYDMYLQSEISLSDATATSRLIETKDLDCETIKESNIKVANRIYEEAKLLEQYEDSGKLTESMKLLHKKYDLLRALLWTSNQKSLERCENYNLIVYLYDYETQNTNRKVIQNVWSKILQEMRTQSYNFLLLPIAANQNLTTIEYLMEEYEVKQLPAIIINNEHVLYELADARPILDLLN
jgi:hypothetical protein